MSPEPGRPAPRLDRFVPIDGDGHRLGRHLRNGSSQVRVNCGTAIVGAAIVGTDERIAPGPLGYRRLGVDESTLSAYPRVEGCHRVAAEVLPPRRALTAAAPGGRDRRPEA